MYRMLMINLSAKEQLQINEFGKDAIDYSVAVYEKYISQGKSIPKQFPFLKAVCTNYLRKNMKCGSFVWNSESTDINAENLRFEKWLRSQEGINHIRGYGLRNVPEHFEVIAREVLREDHKRRHNIKGPY